MIPHATVRRRQARLLPLLAWLATAAAAIPQPYIDWAGSGFTAAERAAGIAAPRHDPDGDGWPNLLEYALGTDPQQPHSQPRPTFEFTGQPAACCPLITGDHAAGLRLLLSDDLIHWHPATAVADSGNTLVAQLGPMRFLRIEAFALPGFEIDSDGDGLHDLFEEDLAAGSPHDTIETIGDVNPFDDADGDGTPNIDEPENIRPPGCGFPAAPLLDPAAVAAAVDNTSPAPATALSVHTPLR